jgi:SAM-dependent methyltransferase
MSELLVGAGHDLRRKVSLGSGKQGWTTLVTLDINPDCNPNIVHDLEQLPYPIPSNSFDEIHAYEVLEHVGKQGDWRFFFAQFDEFARILKPNGLLFTTSPAHESPWVWGDPGHTRYMGPEVYLFLDRSVYEQQLGSTAMTDYRRCFTSNWARLVIEEQNGSSIAVLKNLK